MYDYQNPPIVAHPIDDPPYPEVSIDHRGGHWKPPKNNGGICNPSVGTVLRSTILITVVIGSVLLLAASILLGTKHVDTLSSFGSFWTSIVLLIITAICYAGALTAAIFLCSICCAS